MTWYLNGWNSLGSRKASLDKRESGCYILYQDKGVLHGERAPFFN